MYASNHDGTFEVYALDLATGIERRVTRRPEGTGYRVAPRIDPQGHEIWWWDDDKGSELGVWRAQPFEGGPDRAATDLGPAYSANTAVGSGFALVGRSASLGTTIDLSAEGGSRRLYTHRQAANVGSLSADEQLFTLVHSEHGDARNRAVRVLDRAGTALAELWDGPGRGLKPLRWSPVAGDQRVLVTHERDGIGRPLLWDALTGAERVIDVDLPGEVEPAWYPDATALLLRHEHRGRGELYRYDIASAALEPLSTPSGSIDWVAVRPDGAIWFALGTAVVPRAIVTLDRTRVLPRAIADVPAGRPYRDVVANGVHAFVATPQGPGPHPTFFQVHGGPEAHDEDAFSPTVQAWVDHGYAVVLVNYRGSTGYGREWRDAIKASPGHTELADVAAIHDKLIADGVADQRQAVLSGGSWGGYLTLLGLGTQPARWAAGVAIVPVGDYVAAFEDEMEGLKRYDEALFGGTPESHPEQYRVANPLTYADRVRVPVLITVGQNDPRCPARSVDVYTARLRELGIPYEEYRYDAGHGSLVVDEQLKQMTMEIEFVARSLGTTPAIA